MAEENFKADLTRQSGRGGKTRGAGTGKTLARKLIAFNLVILTGFGGALWALAPQPKALITEAEASLAQEAALIAATLKPNPEAAQQMPLAQGRVLYLAGVELQSSAPEAMPAKFTPLSDLLGNALISKTAPQEALAALSAAPAGESISFYDLSGGLIVAVTAALGDDKLLLTRDGAGLLAPIRQAQERLLQLYLLAALLSVAGSWLLAKTIAKPLAHLAAAAEESEADKAHNRVHLPDMADRPDEIGRLSVALRGMVEALYDRIDSNEQFAADVSHEIKNPLASLRSAVGSLRMVQKPEHRERLLEVIEHDVRRLDRLVSDISNASRLDSELVKEQEEEFNLLVTLKNLSDYLGQQAADKGIDFLTDLPNEPVVIKGLEARLAQVFVNLISNAISFCEKGDAVRIWVRRRDQRVLVVVEDTGPGMPEEALGKVFKRFYSDRPASHFGNNSGLGLSISKQIVEAHSGVIWAENIRPKEADAQSAPLGARFVVGLPI